MGHEGMQDRIFPPRQPDRFSVQFHVAGRGIEAKPAPFQQRLRPARGAAHQRPQARGDLVEVEWLAQIVVGARIQPGNPVGDLVARRQQQDRRGIAPFAQGLEHVEAGPVRQHQVEDQRVELMVPEHGIGLLAAFHGIGVEAADAKPHFQAVAQDRIVLDNQHTHRHHPKFEACILDEA